MVQAIDFNVKNRGIKKSINISIDAFSIKKRNEKIYE